ncbi:MAG: hypothetical protein AAGH46_12180, partial [Bacteroidota bacterium]
MNKTYLVIWILLSVSTILSTCSSQGRIENAQISTKEESNHDKKVILDPEVHVIYQDKKDNLWLVSKEKGVYRY